MAKNKKKPRQKPRQRRKPGHPPRFDKGDKVVVKPGTADPDFSDLPLGGWMGIVTDRHAEHRGYSYDIQWSAETLQAMPAIVKKRAERDGLVLECMTLGENTLESYQGGPVIMEQPNNIITKPLSVKDEDDRIRMIFGLTSDDPLPEVDEETLQRYYEYLQNHLGLPLEAEWHQETQGGINAHRVRILDLLDPEEEEGDDFYGLMADVRQGRQQMVVPLGEIELSVKDPHYQLISDYSSWFWNHR